MGFGCGVTESTRKAIDAGYPVGRRGVLSEICAIASAKARSPVHGYCRMDLRGRLQMALFVPQHMRCRRNRSEVSTKRPSAVERAVAKSKRPQAAFAADQNQTLRVTSSDCADAPESLPYDGYPSSGHLTTISI